MLTPAADDDAPVSPWDAGALGRRSYLLGGASLAAALLLCPREAHATLVRGLTLAQLVAKSELVLQLTPLDAFSHYVDIGDRRSLVTDTLARVDDVLAKAHPPGSELTIRTLGGRLGNTGEIVHGQAELALQATCAAFLKRGQDGAHWVMGMAQGHYPLRADGPQLRLSASPNLPTIRDWSTSAVRRLTGQTLPDARRLVADLVQP